MTTSPPEAKSDRTGMAWIPGGAFAMGSEGFYPEERPVRQGTVAIATTGLA